MKSPFHLYKNMSCMFFKKIPLIVFFIIGNISVVQAQLYQKYTSPKVHVNSKELKNPWAGGLNAPFYSTIDFNGDGIKDLFVFDKQNGATYPGAYKIRTFINSGTPGMTDYVYAPLYERVFPQDLHDWVLLVDYDCDGHEDLFTYSYSGGMAVYHNDYTSVNGVTFSLKYPLVYSTFLGSVYANLYVSNVNLPALVDVNGDGDLDVLTFTLLGGTIEYHENMAKELYNRCDTLIYHQIRQCYAQVGFNAIHNSAILDYANCYYFAPNSPDTAGIRHNGSSLLGFDQNGDGDMDLINGDILGNNLLYLENSGIPGVTDSMISQDSLFPSYDVSVMYHTFPAPFYFDADNDGAKDLIVSGSSDAFTEDYHNSLLYKNIGSNTNNIFQFNKERFLTDEMIDVGSGSNIRFFDVDNDGKQDLLIGNYGYFTNDSLGGHYESAISYYHNITSGPLPEFELITTDFNNLRSLGKTGLNATFGDLNGDGFPDMILGEGLGFIHYYINNGTVPATFTLAPNGMNFQNIDVGNNSAPYLADVNNDGLLDLVIGERLGFLYYYRNTGTVTNPVFTYITNKFGNVNVTDTVYSYNGYSYPLFYRENGVSKLLVSNEKGYIFKYDNIDNNLGGTFNLVSNNTFGIFEPYRATFDVADLNGDGSPEIVTGCYAGGASIYSQNLPTATNEISVPEQQVTAYPNPAHSQITFELKKDTPHTGTYRLYDITGKIVLQEKYHSYLNTISISSLPKGVYTLQIIENNFTYSLRVVKL